MRLVFLLAFTGAFFALASMPALADNPPRYHINRGEYRPLWVFYDYPHGIPQNANDPKKPGYRYYPYYEHRSTPPQDRYDRRKPQRYPVR